MTAVLQRGIKAEQKLKRLKRASLSTDKSTSWVTALISKKGWNEEGRCVEINDLGQNYLSRAQCALPQWNFWSLDNSFCWLLHQQAAAWDDDVGGVADDDLLLLLHLLLPRDCSIALCPISKTSPSASLKVWNCFVWIFPPRCAQCAQCTRKLWLLHRQLVGRTR